MRTIHYTDANGNNVTHTVQKFSVGRTIKDNLPCILVDGDSVFAIFPSMPYGEDHAKQVCEMLNTLHSLTH